MEIVVKKEYIKYDNEFAIITIPDIKPKIKKTETKTLSELNPGEIFKIEGKKFLVLEKESYYTMVADISSEIPIMNFGTDDNWLTSNIRKWLKAHIDDILPNVKTFHFCRDLVSIDYLAGYNECVDIISILSFDEYRKYSQILKHSGILKEGSWWALLTPYGDGNLICCVTEDGNIDYMGKNFEFDILPIFSLSNDLVVENEM